MPDRSWMEDYIDWLLMTSAEVCEYLELSPGTFKNFNKDVGFPAPVIISGKYYWVRPRVIRWSQAILNDGDSVQDVFNDARNREYWRNKAKKNNSLRKQIHQAFLLARAA